MRYATHLSHGGKDINRPELIVIHSMGEYVLDGEHRDHAVKFLDRYGLSAHALGAPDGGIYRCRSAGEIAWHARGHNTNSLGYEFLVEGEHDYASFIERIKTPYVTDAQFKAGVEQVREWIDLFGIKRVVRHSDLSPGRKVDPGTGFPWQEFLSVLGV